MDEDNVISSEEPEKPEPKFSKAEIVFFSLFYIILDALDWLEAGVPLTDAASWLTQFYYVYKGVSGSRMVVGNILEIVPGVDYLPVRTITFWMTVYADRHPKVEAVAELASGKFVAGSKGAPALQHGPAEPSIAARGGEAPALGGQKKVAVSEQNFGMPPEAYEEIEEENFGAVETPKKRGPRKQLPGIAGPEEETEEERLAREEKEFQLEKGMGGGQLEEVKRGLARAPENEAGETDDLEEGEKAA